MRLVRLGFSGKSGGFTLVEAVVVLTVTTIMALVVTGYMLANLEQSTLASNRSTLISETAQSLDLATNDIRLSANADLNNRWPDANSPGGSGNQFGWQSNASTLVLATAAQNNGGGIIFSDSKNYITEKNNLVYFVSGGTLYKRVIASPLAANAAKTTCPPASASTACPADKELLHNVTLFNVKYLDGQNQAVSPTDARSVELHVKVSKQVFGQPVSADYTTKMVFRND